MLETIGSIGIARAADVEASSRGLLVTKQETTRSRLHPAEESFR